MDNVIDKETAEAEFERFCEMADLDLDEALDEEEKSTLENLRRTFVKAVMRGRLVINEKGEAEYTPEQGGVITFYEVRGETLLASDSVKQGKDIARMFAMLGSMTRQPPARFMKMPMRDFKVCKAIFLLFMSSQ
jgi:2-polyprenyl-3-methyl-5-hydroxy-6-metoxy-1,4-benzoquinol methylase